MSERNSNVKFTPNPEYWAPVKKFWRRIRGFDVICFGVQNEPWSNLSIQEQEEIAKIYYMARKEGR